jgi:hypothetical protein
MIGRRLMKQINHNLLFAGSSRQSADAAGAASNGVHRKQMLQASSWPL